MARKPRDIDTELAALMQRAKKLNSQKTTQFGELVQVTGADALPVEALAGALLAAVDQAKKQPEAVARWMERGEAFFRDPARRSDSANGAAGTSPDTGPHKAGATGKSGADAPAGDAANGPARHPGRVTGHPLSLPPACG